MRELGIVAVVVIVLCVVSAAAWMSWQAVLEAGWLVTAAGFALGVPTGVVYHLQLYRALAPRGDLPRGWIWRPLALHDRLRDDERAAVLSWCYAGAAGFLVICLGLVILMVAMVSALRELT